MKHRVQLIAFILMGMGLAIPASGRNYLTRQQALDLYFETGSTQKHARVVSGEEQARLMETIGPLDSRIFSYHTGTLKQNGRTGYAVFGRAMGKLMPFSFMLVTDSDCRIVAVEILSYAESHGSEVRHTRFRGQFKGKTWRDPIRIHDDIRNIAGATISCASLTRAVRKHLVVLTELVRHEETEASFIPARTPTPPGNPPLINDPAIHRLTRSQLLMGTLLEITVETSSSQVDSVHALIRRVFDRTRELERLYSRYRSDSETSHLNRLPVGTTTPVSPDMRHLLALAEQVRLESQGRFDINFRIPGPRPAYRVNDVAGTITILAPLDLDTGAIGKGVALDEAADLVRRSGFTHTLLNFGGQLMAVDKPLSRDHWPISLRNPVSGKVLPRIFTLTHGSLATSGDTPSSRTQQGVSISHIRNGRSGLPVNPTHVSVTVLHASAALADAWSTALYAARSIPETARMLPGDIQSIWMLDATGSLISVHSFAEPLRK